jgi:hypothetical protein
MEVRTRAGAALPRAPALTAEGARLRVDPRQHSRRRAKGSHFVAAIYRPASGKRSSGAARPAKCRLSTNSRLPRRRASRPSRRRRCRRDEPAAHRSSSRNARAGSPASASPTRHTRAYAGHPRTMSDVVLPLFVQLDSGRRRDRAAPDDWFRRGGSVWPATPCSSSVVIGEGGVHCCQSRVMRTLPLARPCSTYARASGVWSNGNVVSMTGRRWPAS